VASPSNYWQTLGAMSGYTQESGLTPVLTALTDLLGMIASEYIYSTNMLLFRPMMIPTRVRYLLHTEK